MDDETEPLDLSKEGGTTADTVMINGKEACRFTHREPLQKNDQELQDLMTSGKFDLFLASDDPAIDNKSTGTGNHRDKSQFI